MNSQEITLSSTRVKKNHKVNIDFEIPYRLVFSIQNSLRVVLIKISCK